uniref:Uncharacterized protein n=1 Tax=Bactrocera dorsalis TaxID=27457 RepID=A0A034W3U4_BACDO
MVEFMETHPNLGKGYVKCADAKQTSKRLWERLSEKLNGDGPPIRDMLSWKKVWADYKTHIKAKARKNKLHMSGTGGGPAHVHSFNAVELQWYSNITNDIMLGPFVKLKYSLYRKRKLN